MDTRAPVFRQRVPRVTRLAGEGAATFATGKLAMTMPKSPRYLWLKIASGE